jgi:hypothetical protein
MSSTSNLREEKMSAQYTIVRYVPDPITEECLNFGVIVWDQNGIHCRFLSDWARVRSFGSENIDFLKHFAKDITDMTSRQLRLGGTHAPSTLTPETLEKMVQNWGQSIQLSMPRGSTKNATDLLADIYPLFLKQRKRHTSQARTRAEAAKAAANIMLEAVRRRVPNAADRLVKKREVVNGRVEQHRFDVVLANGHTLAAVQAISFEIHLGEYLVSEVTAAKWALADTRQRQPLLPLAVFAYPPIRGTARTTYSNARKAFRQLGAEIVTTPQRMERWADERAQAIEIHN